MACPERTWRRREAVLYGTVAELVERSDRSVLGQSDSRRRPSFVEIQIDLRRVTYLT